MSRSKWKGSFLKKNLFKKKSSIKIWSRSSTISVNFLNKKIYIYNGKIFIPLFVKEIHLGFKFGDFSFTRKFIKKTNNKKMLKKNLKK
jgi:small subunit ribosomal protein S19